MIEEIKWGLPKDPRQRVNLSNFAYYVLNEDMSNYGQGLGKSEFICNILINYAPKSKAILFPNEPFLEKGPAFNIRVNEDVERMLYSGIIDNDPNIANVYNTPGNLIKTILEEFFRLSVTQREQFFYQQTIDFFTEMINKKCAVKISNSSGTFVIRPYKFVVDPSNNYNYLIGMSRPTRTDAENERPTSLRLSRLTGSLLPLNSISGKITKEEADYLDERLHTVLPAFFVGENVEVVVRLTENGVRRFNGIHHMRPQLVEIDENNLYHFRCTPFHAKNYFQRLDKDAEIIFPESLRNEMLELFKQAYELYSNSTNQK